MHVMKKMVMATFIVIGCAGCSTVQKYKGVSIEYDAQGHQVRRVESESASQAVQTSETLQFKYLKL
jgi:uncharacterized lipoprotein